MEFILASRSPRRLELLKSIGIEQVLVLPANLDETPHKGEKPKELAERLSCEKAIKVFEDQKERVCVLAADTVVGCGRRVVAAPGNEEEARKCLDILSGKSHRVYTALCLISPEKKIWRRSVDTHVTFKRLTEEEKEAYVQSRQGFDKAGGYAIQGFAGSFIKRINGSYSCILGLPLYEVRNLLLSAGIASFPQNI